MIKIGIVDDQAMVRMGIAQLVGLGESHDVVFQAENGEQAISLLAAQPVDLLISDIQMPVMDGITLIEVLRARKLMTPVLVLTTFNDSELLMRAMRAGANGFLLKDVSLEHLDHAIATVAGGGFLFEPQLLTGSVEAMTQYQNESAPTDITDTEKQLLRLIAAGFNNKDIAAFMNLADGTVKNYISRILEKTYSRDRTQAAVKAMAWKLI
ncbi:MAG: DNA-binding NarL/FixJ family response regulator [Flavobacteriales bacterium]|jgi:DNA-binding NarL/FixJ family response regulator